MSGANLSDANLSGLWTGADPDNLHPSGEDYSIGADLSGANLTGANLSGTNLSGVFFYNTIMPDGSIRA